MPLDSLLGYLRCGEDIVLPITRVELSDRAFILHSESWGPLRAYSGPAYVYGLDGLSITGPYCEDAPSSISWPVVRPGATLTVSFRCSFDHLLPSESSASVREYRRGVSSGQRQLTRSQQT